MASATGVMSLSCNELYPKKLTIILIVDPTTAQAPQAPVVTVEAAETVQYPAVEVHPPVAAVDNGQEGLVASVTGVMESIL